jgi:hypothetical protein
VNIDWKHIEIKELAAMVSEKFKEKDIDVLLVGGACVSIYIYTKNKYLSYDLDFISHALIKEISSVLSELGFKRESTRHFRREDCPFFIEFVSPPAAMGNEPIKTKKKIKTKFGNIILLTPTDCVKDRLVAFYHWNDPQSLEQALMVAKAQKINFKEIKRWSKKEGHNEKYKVFIGRLKK